MSNPGVVYAYVSPEDWEELQKGLTISLDRHSGPAQGDTQPVVIIKTDVDSIRELAKTTMGSVSDMLRTMMKGGMPKEQAEMMGEFAAVVNTLVMGHAGLLDGCPDIEKLEEGTHDH